MKKIFLLTAFTIFITTLVLKAQDNQDRIFGGIRLAPNYSFFIDKAKDWKPEIGYSIGYYEVCELDYRLNLQAEVNYSVRANSYEPANSGKTTFSFKNIELPVAAKYRVSDDFAIGVGYQFSIYKKAKRIFKPIQGEVQKSSLDGISSSGPFLDMSYTKNKTFIGLRAMQTIKSMVPAFDPSTGEFGDEDSGIGTLNVAFYVGIRLF